MFIHFLIYAKKNTEHHLYARNKGEKISTMDTALGSMEVSMASFYN
jgi:hypothetical protein